MADDRKLELIFDDAGRRPEEVLVDTSQFQRIRQTAFQTNEQYDPRFNIKPGDYDDYIKTHMAEFSANIKKVTGDDSIETDPRQYLNTALDYSEIQTASDLNNFVKDHPKLSNNADIKTQLDNLNKIWDITSEEGPATGSLKERMIATAREIANAEIIMTTSIESEQLAGTPAPSNQQIVNTASIQTDMAQFNTNINVVKDTEAIETAATQYQNAALDYSGIQSTSDYKSFIQGNEQLLANPEIKAQLSELADLWLTNGESSQATGDLKDRMDATAQKIANGEILITANTASIQTDMAQFNANIDAVKGTKVIETAAIQYQNTALEYSEMQNTSDFKSFLQDNAELLANPEIKAQITELANLWQANGVSSPPEGELKANMAATAQKIANAEFPLIDQAKSERFANALSDANTTKNLDQLAKSEPLLEGAVMLKKMQIATEALATANPEIANQIRNSEMMELDGSTIIRETGILPQKSPEMIKQYEEINAMLQTAQQENLAPVDESAELNR